MRYLLQNASVYLHGEGFRHADVLVEGERIHAILDGGDALPAYPIDLAGYTLLPGFIHTHAHLMDCFDGFSDAKLSRWLQAGITHVRDQGILSYHGARDAVAWRDRHAKSCMAPSLSVCGSFLSSPGGYGGVFPIGVENAAQAHDAVKMLADAGVDHIKIAYDEGYDPYTQSLPMLDADTLSAIYAQAKAHGLPVSAHVLRAGRLRTLLQTGIDEAAHVCMDVMDDDLLRAMVAAGVRMTPTLSIYAQMHVEYGAPMIHQAMDNTRRFAALGGVIGLGNDYIEEKPIWSPVGMPMMEIELLRKAGLTMEQILCAATYGGAEILGRSDMGRIAPGCMADLIAVKGDPVAYPYLLSDVQFIMKKGVAVKQA